MPRGGHRPGAGRKPGSVNRMSTKAREQAATTGELPHEFLLRVARGELVDGHVPAFNERMDAAKAAAPYFAPRLATAQFDVRALHANRSAEDLTNDELAIIAAGGTLN